VDGALCVLAAGNSIGGSSSTLQVLARAPLLSMGDMGAAIVVDQTMPYVASSRL
jgi:hypothetical protein